MPKLVDNKTFDAKWISITAKYDLSGFDLLPSLNYSPPSLPNGIIDQNGGILNSFEALDIPISIEWYDLSENMGEMKNNFAFDIPRIAQTILPPTENDYPLQDDYNQKKIITLWDNAIRGGMPPPEEGFGAPFVFKFSDNADEDDKGGNNIPVSAFSVIKNGGGRVNPVQEEYNIPDGADNIV